MTTVNQTWYEYLFGEEEIQADEKSKRQKYLVTKQILDSNIRLRKTFPTFKEFIKEKKRGKTSKSKYSLGTTSYSQVVKNSLII